MSSDSDGGGNAVTGHNKNPLSNDNTRDSESHPPLIDVAHHMTTESEAFSQEDLDEDDIPFVRHSSQCTVSTESTPKSAIISSESDNLQLPNAQPGKYVTASHTDSINCNCCPPMHEPTVTNSCRLATPQPGNTVSQRVPLANDSNVSQDDSSTILANELKEGTYSLVAHTMKLSTL